MLNSVALNSIWIGIAAMEYSSMVGIVGPFVRHEMDRIIYFGPPLRLTEQRSCSRLPRFSAFCKKALRLLLKCFRLSESAGT
jgi:hypothetical protein